MKKPKYVVMTHFESFYSDSRNARKHLLELDADVVRVYSNSAEPKLLCMAQRGECNTILVGVSK